MNAGARAAGETSPAPVPRYGERALADVMPAVLASVGVPGFADVLGLTPARAACVLLVDGLGSELILAHAADAPFLHAALTAAGAGSPHGGVLTAGFPSTTAASLASLGTGLPPGTHGIVGYRVAVPGTGRLMHSLRWDPDVDPLIWQPHHTAFERAVAAGAMVTRVSQRQFRESGMTRAALRGGEYRGGDTFGEVADGVAVALSAAIAARHPGLVYAYVSDLDATGHRRGPGSRAWRVQLRLIDRLVAEVAELLPSGAALYVTADHGMVDVPRDRRIDVDADPDLRDGVLLLGGEPRARYLYTAPGAAPDVLATWRAKLAGEAWVVSREEAVTAGWFGPVAEGVLPRIGEVIAAVRTDAALVATRAEPSESRLAGHHGSMTSAEQFVPFLEFRG